MSIENLTSSERAYLRSLANTLDAIFQLGKGGINENFIKQIDDVLVFSNHLHHLHLGDQVRQVFLCCIRCMDKAEGMEKHLRWKEGRQDKN